MLVTFKSKAAAEVLMYEEHAKRILDLLQKDVQKGIITAAELPQAIARLEAEIADSNERATPGEDETPTQGDGGDEDEQRTSGHVSFATRVYPFLEMLRAAQKKDHDVVWGV